MHNLTNIELESYKIIENTEWFMYFEIRYENKMSWYFSYKIAKNIKELTKYTLNLNNVLTFTINVITKENNLLIN